jgi:hypothetical protein
VLARLDRVYSFASNHGLSNSHIRNYNIIGDSCHSDHLPVMHQVDLLENQRHEGSRYKMNKRYLEDAAVVDQLRKEWQQYPRHLHFFTKMKKITIWYKLFCWQKARETKASELQLRRELKRLQAELQTNPICPHLQATIAGAQDSLSKEEQ